LVLEHNGKGALMAKTTLAEEWLGKGLVLFETQEYEKAIMAYEQALRIVPLLADGQKRERL